METSSFGEIIAVGTRCALFHLSKKSTGETTLPTPLNYSGTTCLEYVAICTTSRGSTIVILSGSLINDKLHLRP